MLIVPIQDFDFLLQIFVDMFFFRGAKSPNFDMLIFSEKHGSHLHSFMKNVCLYLPIRALKTLSLQVDPLPISPRF